MDKQRNELAKLARSIIELAQKIIDLTEQKHEDRLIDEAKKLKEMLPKLEGSAKSIAESLLETGRKALKENPRNQEKIADIADMIAAMREKHQKER